MAFSYIVATKFATRRAHPHDDRPSIKSKGHVLGCISKHRWRHPALGNGAHPGSQPRSEWSRRRSSRLSHFSRRRICGGSGHSRCCVRNHQPRPPRLLFNAEKGCGACQPHNVSSARLPMALGLFPIALRRLAPNSRFVTDAFRAAQPER